MAGDRPEVILGIEDEAGIRASPAIYALIVICDHPQIAMDPVQSLQQLELGKVDVLRFIDQDMAELPGYLLAERRRRPERRHRTDDQVGKIPVSAIGQRSEEHTSELQSLMRSSYAVF